MSELMDLIYDPFGLMDDSQDEAEEESGGMLESAKDWAAEQGGEMARTAMVNQLPGAGSLFTYGAADGLRFTPLGQKLLLAAAGYGLWRMLAGGR